MRVLQNPDNDPEPITDAGNSDRSAATASGQVGPKPTRSWLRRSYSLRAPFIVITVVAIWCAFHANRGRYERAVESEFQALGGRVLSGTYDPTAGKTLEPTAYERLMMRLFGRRFIASIQITGDTLPDAKLPSGLVNRAFALPHLQCFEAKRCQIQDADMGNLGRAKGLLSLSLPDNPVTDQGLVGLDRLDKLQFVNLQQTGIADETLFRIARLPELVILSISYTKVTGKEMPPLAAKSTLKSLYGEHTMLCDDFLISIAKCERLENVLLEHCAFTDAGMLALEKHPNLVHIALYGNKKLTDQSLHIFSTLPHLKRLSMGDCKYTREGVSDFRKRRPDVDL